MPLILIYSTVQVKPFDLLPKMRVGRLMVGFVAMIFFGHLVVAACNWSVPRAAWQSQSFYVLRS